MTTAPYLFIASMDVDPAHEVDFNEVYNTEHIPALANVPGVLSVVRYEKVELRMPVQRQHKPACPCFLRSPWPRHKAIRPSGRGRRAG